MLDFYYNLDNRLPFLLLLMIFLHIIADYKVQDDFMATYKQKKNWEEYIKKDKQYRYDYIVILLVHAFSWSFITFFPMLLEVKSILAFSVIVIVNTIVHALIDDLKANKFKINLIQDQAFHLFQISLTMLIFSI